MCELWQNGMLGDDLWENYFLPAVKWRRCVSLSPNRCPFSNLICQDFFMRISNSWKRATWILSSCARLRLAYPPTFPSWIHEVLQNALYSSVRVNQKSDCRLVKNHQFACIHVGNKGQVFESKLDGIFLSSLFYSFSVTGPHIFCWWFLFENIDLPRA